MLYGSGSFGSSEYAGQLGGGKTLLILQGKYTVKTTRSLTESGKYEIIVIRYLEESGVYKVLTSHTITESGEYRLLFPHSLSLGGKYEIETAPKISLPGIYAIIRNRELSLDGAYRLLFQHSISLSGEYVVPQSVILSLLGEYEILNRGRNFQMSGQYIVSVIQDIQDFGKDVIVNSHRAFTTILLNNVAVAANAITGSVDVSKYGSVGFWFKSNVANTINIQVQTADSIDGSGWTTYATDVLALQSDGSYSDTYSIPIFVFQNIRFQIVNAATVTIQTTGRT